MQEFLSLKPVALWNFFRKERFAFLAICGYLIFEYFRPQSLMPSIDFLPWSQLWVVLAGLGWVLDGQKGPRVSNSVGAWMIAFFAVILLSSSFAYFPKVAFSYLNYYYTWLIIFFLISFNVTSEKRFFIFLLIFLLASYKMSLFGTKTWAMRGFSFKAWGIRGPPGFFTNSGELAVQMAVFFGVSYYFFQAVKNHISGWKYWLVASFPFTAAMTVLGASSRGSQLALAAQAYFMFLHGRLNVRSILAIATVVGAGYYLLPEEQFARFESAGDDQTSQQRLLYWQHGWEMMKEHPLLGVGHFNFPPYFGQHYPEDLLFGVPQLAHNIFIQVGADLGFTGLAVYLVLIGLGFAIPVRVRKRLREQGKLDDWRIPISKGLAVGFLGFLIGGQFVSIAYYPYMWIHLAFCCALLNTTHVPQSSQAGKAATGAGQPLTRIAEPGKR